MNMKVSMFGLQTGNELVSRIRYMYGHRAVDDATADLVLGRLMSVPTAVEFISERFPNIQFVDAFPNDTPWYSNRLADDIANNMPIDGMYEAVLVSLVQPASYVRLTKDGEHMQTLLNDLCSSGLYSILTVTEV